MSRARILGGILSAALAVAAPLSAYYEGMAPVGYADPVGIPTDCLGETGPDVKVGVQRFTFDECIARHGARLAGTWESLSNCIRVDVTVNQAAAIISFADNTGVTATCTSTMIRMLNAGAPPEQWCPQMLRWDKAHIRVAGVGGPAITLPGLTKRRRSEMQTCLGDPPALPGMPPNFGNVRAGAGAVAEVSP